MVCAVGIALNGSGATAAEDNQTAVARLSSTSVANGQVTVIEVNLRDRDPAATNLKARFDQNAIAP